MHFKENIKQLYKIIYTKLYIILFLEYRIYRINKHMSDSKKIKKRVKLKSNDIHIDTSSNYTDMTTDNTNTISQLQLQIHDISPTTTPTSYESKPITLNQPPIYNDKIQFIEKKKEFFESVIQKTSIHIQNQRQYDIINIEEYNKCINNLYKENIKLKSIHCDDNMCDIENAITSLQMINTEISSILREHGTKSLDDLIKICLGTNNLLLQDNEDIQIYNLLKEYFHPVNYKIKIFSQIPKPTQTTQTPQIKPDDTTNTINIRCDDIDTNLYSNNKTFYMKVFGIQFEITNNYKKMIISGYLDNVVLDLLNNAYINNKKTDIIKNIPKSKEFKKQPFYNFIESLLLKDYLIYNKTEIYNKYIR